MDEVIVGFGVRIGTTAAINEETAVLILVVGIRTHGAGVILEKRNMVEGSVERYAFYTHTIIFIAEKLHPSVFVAGGEDEGLDIFINDFIA